MFHHIINYSHTFYGFLSFPLIMQAPLAPSSTSFASLINCTGQYITNFIHIVITNKDI